MSIAITDKIPAFGYDFMFAIENEKLFCSSFPAMNGALVVVPALHTEQVLTFDRPMTEESAANWLEINQPFRDRSMEYVAGITNAKQR